MPVPSQGHYVFTVFRLLTDFFCLYTYEFLLSLCKIVRSSVILLLSLFSANPLVSVTNVIRAYVRHAQWSNAHDYSGAQLQKTISSYTALPPARRKISSTSWNVQFVAFNTSVKLGGNLIYAWKNTEARQRAILPVHSANISVQRATMIISTKWRSP